MVYYSFLSNTILLVFLFYFNLSAYFDKKPEGNSSKETLYVVRIGQGGFKDNRSEIGKLGGGQIALDFKSWDLPLLISITNEYYTNSNAPSNSYEIENLIALNILYHQKLFKLKKTTFFAGGGAGIIRVPFEDSGLERTAVYNLEIGMNFKVYWKFGIYIAYKYLYANKNLGKERSIDFSEHIILLGISINNSY